MLRQEYKCGCNIISSQLVPSGCQPKQSNICDMHKIRPQAPREEKAVPILAYLILPLVIPIVAILLFIDYLCLKCK
jgi:hypothetical protein